MFTDKENKAHKVDDVNLISRIKHASSKKRNTFINVYHFKPQESSVSLTVKFLNTNKRNSVSVTEANVFINLEKEITGILETLRERRMRDKKF